MYPCLAAMQDLRRPGRGLMAWVAPLPRVIHIVLAASKADRPQLVLVERLSLCTTSELDL